MSLKKIKAKLSVFKYNPSANLLWLVSGTDTSFVRLCWHPGLKQFEIDQNPHGETDPVPISNISLKPDFSELRFDALYQNKQASFIVSATHPCDRIIYEIFAYVKELRIDPNNQDRIEIVLKNGLLSNVDIYKYQSQRQIDSLTFFIEDHELLLIKRNPWARVKLNTIKVKDEAIICQSDTEEFVYKLDTEPFILNIVKRLIECGTVSLT